MKKAMILPLALIFFVIISFICLNFLRFSAHTPNFVKNMHSYSQTQILRKNAKELAKYLLFVAKNQGKDCLESLSLNYPKADDIAKFEFFYPLAKCENFTLTELNHDANLSKDKLIIVHFSHLLHANSLNERGVNDEIFTNEIFYLYPQQDANFTP